jgi:hypothetical protein
MFDLNRFAFTWCLTMTTIDRSNTGQANQSALIAYFRERANSRMVKWLAGCLIRFDTVLWGGKTEKYIVELYVNDVPEPPDFGDFDRPPTEEEARLGEAFKDLCDPQKYLGYYLFQLRGRLWTNPHQAVTRAGSETQRAPVTRPDAHQEVGLNNCFFPSDRVMKHDELRFRSPAEISIYDELKKRRLLFFPNAAAILGETGKKREPDFLICHKGKWGVLEVMGQTYHTDPVKDHDRARLFKEHGLLCIEFFPANRCEGAAAKVVDEFLSLLDSY